MKPIPMRRLASVLMAFLLASFVTGTAGAATTYSDYVIFGEHGVMIGAGSEVTGLVGARYNNAGLYPLQPDTALEMNGGAKILGRANIGGAGSSADVNVANTVTITQLYYVDSFSHGATFTGTATQQIGGTDIPAALLPTQSVWPGGLGSGCPTGGTDYTGLGNGFSLTLTPGSYGDIDGGGGGDLTFNGAGDYFLDRLNAGNGLTIHIPTPGIRVFVCEDVVLGDGSVDPTTILPGGFLMEVYGSGVAVGTSAFTATAFKWIGNLLVPSRGVHFGSSGGGATWLGSILADHVDIEHGVVTTKPPSKSGVKFNDVDNSGTYNAGDTLLAGWTIQLRDSTNTSVVATDVTDASGAYEFLDIAPGTYYVCEVQQANWTQTFPNGTTPNPLTGKDEVTNLCPSPAIYGYKIVVVNGDSLNGDDFGNFQRAPGGQKSGFKFYDADNSGSRTTGDYAIANWPINLLKFNGSAYVQVDTTTTAADGTYSFVIPDNGSYRVCEGSGPSGYVQTFPNAGTTPPSGETITSACPGPNVYGYQFVIAGGENLRGNDFGNRVPTVTCIEDPNRAALLTRTVNTSKPLGGGGVPGNPQNFHTLQAAYDVAKVSTASEVIGMFSKTVENVVLDGDKAFTITQCESARLTAADASKSVWKITNTKKLLIIGPDSVGGTIGWELVTGGHELKSIRANDASQWGVKVSSSNNTVSWNAVDNNLLGGVQVVGNYNVLKGSSATGNGGDGVQLLGNYNNLSGSNIVSNTGNGVLIQGSYNTVKDNGRINLNKLNGILITGSNNTVSGNKSESGKGNTLNGIKVASGSANQLTSNQMNSNGQAGFDIAAGTGTKLKSNTTSNNTGNEYTIGAGNTDQTGNKKNGTSFTFTTAAGGTFN